MKWFGLVGHDEFDIVLRVAIKPFYNMLLYVRHLPSTSVGFFHPSISPTDVLTIL
ncbi:MAG TPA: hypothetical protein VFU67_05185 [Nitrososphaeraceae archaeon]|nr:hypothetical protein [Nitrososphaeraceae archaeon]